jgi:hypothetical protein
MAEVTARRIEPISSVKEGECPVIEDSGLRLRHSQERFQRRTFQPSFLQSVLTRLSCWNHLLVRLFWKFRVIVKPIH